MNTKTLRAVGAVALLVVVVLLLWGRSDPADDRPEYRSGYQQIAPTAEPGDEVVDPHSGLPWIEVAELTPEGRETLALIEADGPFPYPDVDGSTFGNRERLLPDAPRGYYAEYTVPTPGEDDRGARRIVAGDGGEYYWTVDHYASFERIRVVG